MSSIYSCCLAPTEILVFKQPVRQGVICNLVSCLTIILHYAVDELPVGLWSVAVRYFTLLTYDSDRIDIPQALILNSCRR